MMGTQSERTFIKQFVQKFVGSTEEENLFNVEDETSDDVDLSNHFNY